MQKTKKLLTIVITAIVFLWTLAMMPAPSSAATLNVPGEYSTIQAAIEAASVFGGGTVQVAPGTYDESITMEPGVTIQGSGADKTTIEADTWYTVSGADNSTISGFTIKGGKYGIYNFGTSPTITNNIITGNSYYGIYNSTSSPTITNNIITDNNYCGILNWWFSSPTITNSIITGNGRGTVNYGGIYNYSYSSPTITNNTITGNNPYGIYNYASSPRIINNIITGNSAHGIYNESSPPTITYNNLWGYGSDETAIWNDSASNPRVANNINADPMFVDASSDDYHLQLGSPCIDAGTNDPYDDTETNDLPDTDFDGNRKILDGNGDGVAIVDMGAFEYQGTGEKSMDMECFAVNYMKVIDKKKRNAKRDKIKIRGSFKLAEGAAPFDPLNDDVTLTIDYINADGVSKVITVAIPPADLFKQKKHSLWRFKDDIDGVRVHMHLNFDKCRWWIKIRGKDTSGLVGSSSLTVKLNIGMNTGYDIFGWTKQREKHRIIGFAKFIERPRIRCCR